MTHGTQGARIKICGVTNPEDARIALAAGAGVLGFNLYPRSKRYITLDALAAWLPAVPGEYLRVAVMVNPSLEEVAQARNLVDVVQLHGQESPDFCHEAAESGRIWKALPLTPGLDPAVAAGYGAEALVIDTSVPGAFGGTGKLIDLDLAADFVTRGARLTVWLSGGLDAGNVAEAIGKVRPYGVDVASGVEAAGNPRRKDEARVRRFVEEALTAMA
jgi:phosphoribosylanthranilate isomerase